MRAFFYSLPLVALAVVSCGSAKVLPTLIPTPVETTRTVETKVVTETPIAEPKSVDYSEYMVRIMEPKNVIITAPLMADVTVTHQKRIKYVETAAFADVDPKEDISKDISTYKHIAYAKAAAMYDADLLISPSFVIETVNDKLQITVYGYPAVYTNFRNASKQDIEFSKLMDTQQEVNFDTKDSTGAPRETVVFDKNKKR